MLVCNHIAWFQFVIAVDSAPYPYKVDKAKNASHPDYPELLINSVGERCVYRTRRKCCPSNEVFQLWIQC